MGTGQADSGETTPAAVMLGLGAWWEPIAGRVGVKRDQAAAGHARVCRSHPPAVHHGGGHLSGRVRQARPRQARRGLRRPAPARHPHLHRRHRRQDAGTDGRDLRRRGAELRRRRSITSAARWNWWPRARPKPARPSTRSIGPNCSSARSATTTRQAAMFEGKKLVAYYLATEPHIMKASGVPEDLIAQRAGGHGLAGHRSRLPRRCAGHPRRCGAQADGGGHQRRVRGQGAASTSTPASPARSSTR